MSFTIDDVDEVLNIIKEFDGSELHMEIGDVKLSLFRGEIGDSARSSLDFSRESAVSQPEQLEPAAAAPAAAPAPAAVKEEPEVVAAPAEAEKKEEIIEEGLVPITSSVTSVFYRAPSPDEPPFVEVGSEIEEDTVVCLLEVMKCFRSVTSGVKGRIEKVCADNAQMVENGTVLFLVRPA